MICDSSDYETNHDSLGAHRAVADSCVWRGATHAYHRGFPPRSSTCRCSERPDRTSRSPGTFEGEIDPSDRRSAVIVDIGLAPQVGGKVRYTLNLLHPAPGRPLERQPQALLRLWQPWQQAYPRVVQRWHSI